MSRTIIKIIPLLLLLITGFQCKRNNDPAPQNVLTGKLIASDGCSQAVVEILDGQYDPALVVATWKDTDNDSVYHNVFRLGNVRGACAIEYFGVTKGDTFQFQMDPHPPYQVCNTCNILTLLAMPPVTDNVMNVKKIDVAQPL
jgi:hypothetical protein